MVGDLPPAAVCGSCCRRRTSVVARTLMLLTLQLCSSWYSATAKSMSSDWVSLDRRWLMIEQVGHRTVLISIFTLMHHAFSALTLLVGRQGEHPACRSWMMRCGCGYLSRLRCGLFAIKQCNANIAMVQLMPLHPQTPSSFASFKSRLVFTFLVPAYPGFPGKEAVKRV